jgi:hypothetical protein
MKPADLSTVRLVVFDAMGTLFDLSALDPCFEAIGGRDLADAADLLVD